MMKMKKSFDRDLYERADTQAKKHMIGWLEHSQPRCTVNSEETTYFDLTVKTDDLGDPQFYEVEIKYAWKEEWPENWTELRIPFRKKRLLDRWKERYSDCLLTFVVFNHDCSRAWHVDGNTVLDSEVKEASNKHIRKGELFFHIPVDQAYQVDMTYDKSSS
jgi:hypothetical protein